jgi:hypothetical protein
LWNFTVTAFDQATGTLTVSPDCVRADPADSVQEGDVLIVRTIAQNVDPAGAWIEDPVWHNDVSATQFPGSAGLDPDVEVGRLVRILFGTGAGQIRTIVANPGTNPNTRLYVDPPFETVPDHTSVYIIEARDWDYASLTTPLAVPKPGNSFELRVRVDNLADMVVLVGGFLVDDQGRISDEEFAVYREIYVYGQPPTVRVIGPEAIDADRVDAAGNPDPGPWQVFATDHTIRADTSGTADVQCELMPIAAYAGRTLYFVNDVGPNNLIVTCAPGEALFDGNDTVTVKPLQTMKLTAG